MTAHHRRHQSLQLARRCVQAGAAGFTITLIFLALYHHYHASRALDQMTVGGGLRGSALSMIERGMHDVADPGEFLRRNNGNLWSMRIAGREIADPLAFVEASAAARRIHTPLLLAIVGPVLLTIFLGRVFCSWICPGYVVFELAGRVRNLLERFGMQPARVEFSRRNKYAVLAAGVVIAVATGLPIFSMFYPPALLSRTAHAIIFGTGVAGMLTILSMILAFEVLVSPRWWCRTMCPGGALYGLLGGARVLRVRLVADRCTACKLCQPACEEGLNPVSESSGLECDNCGACVRDCPDRALLYRIGLPGKSATGPIRDHGQP